MAGVWVALLLLGAVVASADTPLDQCTFQRQSCLAVSGESAESLSECLEHTFLPVIAGTLDKLGADAGDETATRLTQCQKNRVDIPLAAQEKLISANRGGQVQLLRQLQNRLELPRLLIDLGLTGVGAELGVHRGAFSQFLLRNWPGVLVLVDAWSGVDGYPDDRHDDIVETQRVVAGFDDRVEFKPGLTQDVHNDFEDGTLDFIYLDASHTYAAARRDLTLWYPKVKRGGLVAGHDYVNTVVNMFGNKPVAFGVRDMIDEFTGLRGIRLYTTTGATTADDVYPTWYFLKCE